jgi:hypothetical protein
VSKKKKIKIEFMIDHFYFSSIYWVFCWESVFADAIEILHIGGRVHLANNGQNIQLVNGIHNHYEVYFNRI